MFASLPMYDLAELREQTDALWGAIARNVRAQSIDAVPGTLVRPAGGLHQHWADHSLLLSQTCGAPLVSVLPDTVHVLGSFACRVDEAGRPGWYRSVVVCRVDDLRADVAAFDGAPVAVNDELSLSGFVSLGVALGDAGARPGTILPTGAHASSVEAVLRGAADLASIDAHTFALLLSVRPWLRGELRIIGRGPLVASLPLITAYPEMVSALRTSITNALGELDPGTLDALQIEGFVPRGREVHEPVRALLQTARTVMGDHA